MGRFRVAFAGTPVRSAVALAAVMLLAPACSIRRVAINRVADSLASTGTTFQSDDDLQLVGAALPFGLKLYESLLSEAPRHKGLLLAACEGFASYSYIYVQVEAEKVIEEDLQRGKEFKLRARRLYQRALGYCQRSLDVSYAGLSAGLAADPKVAVSRVRKREDVPQLYWTAVALGLAISVAKNDTEMLGQVPVVEALIDRAVQLDESWKDGALLEFQVNFASAKPGGADPQLVAKQYRRALDLSQGRRAGLFVTYAEASALPQQNRAEFEALLNKALAVDPDQHLSLRLANLLAQQRARWLLSRIDDLVIAPEPLTQEGVKP